MFNFEKLNWVDFKWIFSKKTFKRKIDPPKCDIINLHDSLGSTVIGVVIITIQKLIVLSCHNS